MDIINEFKGFISAENAKGIVSANPLLDLFLYYIGEKQKREAKERKIKSLERQLKVQEKYIDKLRMQLKELRKQNNSL